MQNINAITRSFNDLLLFTSMLFHSIKRAIVYTSVICTTLLLFFLGTELGQSILMQLINYLSTSTQPHSSNYLYAIASYILYIVSALFIGEISIVTSYYLVRLATPFFKRMALSPPALLARNRIASYAQSHPQKLSKHVAAGLTSLILLLTFLLAYAIPSDPTSNQHIKTVKAPDLSLTPPVLSRANPSHLDRALLFNFDQNRSIAGDAKITFDPATNTYSVSFASR